MMKIIYYLYPFYKDGSKSEWNKWAKWITYVLIFGNWYYGTVLTRTYFNSF